MAKKGLEVKVGTDASNSEIRYDEATIRHCIECTVDYAPSNEPMLKAAITCELPQQVNIDHNLLVRNGIDSWSSLPIVLKLDPEYTWDAFLGGMKIEVLRLRIKIDMEHNTHIAMEYLDTQLKPQFIEGELWPKTED